MYLSFADVTFSFQNGTEKGPRGYFLGPLWSTLGSNGGCNCNCNNTVWFEMVQCSSSASDIERCSGSAQSKSVVCFWNRHRKCWWNKTSAMPKSISMAMAMSIFECLGSWMKFFWGGAKGLLRLGAVPNEVVYRSTWMWLLLGRMSGRLKVKKFFNVFLSKLGCFKAF